MYSNLCLNSRETVPLRQMRTQNGRQGYWANYIQLIQSEWTESHACYSVHYNGIQCTVATFCPYRVPTGSAVPVPTYLFGAISSSYILRAYLRKYNLFIYGLYIRLVCPRVENHRRKGGMDYHITYYYYTYHIIILQSTLIILLLMKKPVKGTVS